MNLHQHRPARPLDQWIDLFWYYDSFVPDHHIEHFIKLFRETVGLTPKRFSRVARFQQVLRDVQARRDVRWADVALACGYYDQAHMIHEFESFCGLTPERFIAQSADRLNYIPVD